MPLLLNFKHYNTFQVSFRWENNIWTFHRLINRRPITRGAVTTGSSVGPRDFALEKLTVNCSIDLPCRICYFPSIIQYISNICCQYCINVLKQEAKAMVNFNFFFFFFFLQTRTFFYFVWMLALLKCHKVHSAFSPTNR